MDNMAKVIKIDKSKMKQITHSSCGAVIEYFDYEVKRVVEDEPYGGGTDTYNYLQCPNCKYTMRWC